MSITAGVHNYTEALPDLPDTVHGIKQVGDVWAVQCDDCLTVHASATPIIACSSVRFNSKLAATPERYTRLCAVCWQVRGWSDSPSRGWQVQK